MIRIHPILIAVILALVAAAPAEATTIVAPPSSPYPYQAWADKAAVPTPPGTVEVIEDAVACGGQASACTGQHMGRDLPISIDTYLSGETFREVRQVFYHELGHHFDYEVMQDWARARFEQLVGDYRPWVPAINEAQPNAPREKFAEAWMRCAYSTTIKRAPQSYGYLYRPTPKIHAKVCRLIERVAA